MQINDNYKFIKEELGMDGTWDELAEIHNRIYKPKPVKTLDQVFKELENENKTVQKLQQLQASRKF